MSKIGDKILSWPWVRKLIALSRKVVLPGFDGLPLYDVGVYFIKGLFKGAIVTRASAVSFKVFLALLPFTIMLLSLIPYIPIENFQGELLDEFKEMLPAGIYDLLQGALDDLVNRKHNTVLSIGFVLTLYYASNSINAILTSFNSSYHLSVRRNPIKQRVISLILIVLITCLGLAAMSLMVFSDSFFRWLEVHHYVEGRFVFMLLYFVKWIMVILLFLVIVSVLYNTGDTERNTWKVVTAGSTMATLSMILVSIGFTYYVTNFGQYNKLYGSLGTIIVLLLWINLNSMILLIGFELNASILNAKKQKLEL